MSKLTIVTFLKSWQGYAAGETAGFSKSKADDLVKGKVAVLGKKKGSKEADDKADAAAAEKSAADKLAAEQAEADKKANQGKP